WAEMHIGTSAPVNGSDYSATLLKQWTTSCSASGLTAWNNGTSTGCITDVTSYTPASTGTYYITLKSGDSGTSTGVSWDNLTICTCTSAPTPSAPSLANERATTLELSIASGDSSLDYFAIRVNGSSSQWVQADGSIGASAVWRTKAQWNA